VFCDAVRIPVDEANCSAYPVWKCSCGAIGSGALLPDLDEVGDQLLCVLGIRDRVSQPCVPTDHPAISIQCYDVNQIERDMAGILKRNGYEFRIAARDDPNERLFWVKKNARNA